MAHDDEDILKMNRKSCSMVLILQANFDSTDLEWWKNPWIFFQEQPITSTFLTAGFFFDITNRNHLGRLWLLEFQQESCLYWSTLTTQSPTKINLNLLSSHQFAAIALLSEKSLYWTQNIWAKGKKKNKSMQDCENNCRCVKLKDGDPFVLPSSVYCQWEWVSHPLQWPTSSVRIPTNSYSPRWIIMLVGSFSFEKPWLFPHEMITENTSKQTSRESTNQNPELIHSQMYTQTTWAMWTIQDKINMCILENIGTPSQTPKPPTSSKYCIQCD